MPCQRHLFEIPPEVTYLNCAYMSPILRATREAGVAAVGRKSHPWQIHPADFFTDPETARTLFARLIGGPAENKDPGNASRLAETEGPHGTVASAEGVAIVPSVSYGIAVAAANLPLAAGQTVVVLAEQFPSNFYQWRALAERRAAQMVTVPRPSDHDWTAAVLRHIDARTAIVAVPNCHWTDGGLLDLAHVGARARAAGAALVVDATQSLGAHPLDVNVVQPDFLVAATYKWLLGPSSLGFLYVAPKHRAGTPIEHGWLARAGSEDFRSLVQYRDEYQPGARRYDMGERANFTLLPMAISALQQLLAWGVPSIAATLRLLTDRVEAEAGRLGLRAVPSDRRAGHMIGVRLPDGLPAGLDARLAAAHIHVSLRGDSIRISPHLYNTPEDVERLFATLAAR